MKKWYIQKKNVERIYEKLCHAHKPLLVIGQGIRQAGAIDILQDFLQDFCIPVISSRLGQDILPYGHSCYCGHGGSQGSPATKKIMAESDMVLSLGSSLSPSFLGYGKALKAAEYVCAVDIEPGELEKNIGVLTERILCDVKLFLELLRDVSKNRKLETESKDWMSYCIECVKNQSLVYNVFPSNPLNINYFIHAIDELADESCVFVSDAGTSYYATGQSLSFQRAKREIVSGTFGSMGLAVPLAIGAACAERGNTILAITGDGSIESNIQELCTLAVEQLNVKLFVINNGGYLSIRNAQDSKFQGRYINSNQGEDDTLLDFSKVAECFGLPYFCIERHEEIPKVYQEITHFSGPALIEVLCDHHYKIFQCY